MTVRALVVAITICTSVQARSFGLDVIGTVTDSPGAAVVPEVEVVVHVVSTSGQDTPYASTYTDSTGQYGKSIAAGPLPSSFTVYAVVNWRMQLGFNYGNKHIILKDRGPTDPQSGNYLPLTTFTSVTSASVAGTPTGTVTLNITMAQRQPNPPAAPPVLGGLSNIRNAILATLDYVRSQKTTGTTWSFQHDIEVHIVTTASAGSWEEGGNLWLNVSAFSTSAVATPTLNNNIGDIYHETAHAIHTHTHRGWNESSGGTDEAP